MQEEYNNKNLEKNFRMERLAEDLKNLQKLKGKLECEVEELRSKKEELEVDLAITKKEYGELKKNHDDKIKSISLMKSQEIVQ